MSYNFTQDELDKLDEQYQKFVDENQNLSWEQFAEKINLLPVHHKRKNYFRQKFCGEFLGYYCGGWTHYPKKISSFDKSQREIFCDVVKHLPQSHYYLWSVYHFFNGDYENCELCLEKIFQYFDGDYNEEFFAQRFLQDFKNAYPNFWRKMAKRFKRYDATEAEELANLFEGYYSAENNEKREGIFINHIQAHPTQVLPKEFLGFLYEDMKLWYNAIQIFEQVKDKSVFWFDSDIYFQLGWSYGKVKEYPAEEENYRRCLEIAPECPNALNNFGYCLYRQRRLDEAEKIFLQCLDEERDLPYPVNNLVRTYLMSGKIDAAKKFIATTKFKVDKSLVKRVKNYSPKKISSEQNFTQLKFFLDDSPDDTETISERRKNSDEPSTQQFANEKILEDEIVARIESGEEIFGLKLKIYRRDGDFYGRQYPFSDGKKNYRIDILCEDERGNFYIIELKKDSGYGDAYSQIKTYVDYFERRRARQGKKVFGILCLNSPTESLLQRVRADNRIRVFEYKISYVELA